MNLYRYLLFLFGCIGVRSLLTYTAYSYKNISLLPLVTSLIGLGFFIIYLTNSRKTGPEVFGEQIWWNNLRPVHGTLYLLFSIAYYYKVEYAWIFLLLDVIIGLTAFINKRVLT
jgi:hypothetical protein